MSFRKNGRHLENIKIRDAPISISFKIYKCAKRTCIVRVTNTLCSQSRPAGA